MLPTQHLYRKALSMEKNYSLLCLGDSYTIGEQVPIHHSFPYQTIQLLRQMSYQFQAPEIVAQTGWTSAELLQANEERILPKHFDFVTLLIGVNDQYRQLSIDNYRENFELLIQLAISFVNTPAHCIVLSIPDYGVTPFAAEKDPAAISAAIAQYNQINAAITATYKAKYINITPLTQLAADEPDLLTADQLHPSEKAYHQWANLVANAIEDRISGK